MCHLTISFKVFLLFVSFMAIITSIWPIQFPFQILCICDFSVSQFLFTHHPFPHKFIYKSVIKPHTHRRLVRPVFSHIIIRGFRWNISIASSICTDESEKIDCISIIFIKPEKCLHDILSTAGNRTDK